jgi:hypothetical protein
MPAKPPYLNAVFFCENVLQEADGVVSAIRIVDRIFVPRINSQSSEPQDLVALTLFLGFKGGGYVGEGTVTLSSVAPSGKKTKSMDVIVQFPKEPNSGANVIARTAFTFHEEGVYWFDVVFNGELITRTPIDVQLMTLEMQKSLLGAVPQKPT